MVAMEERQLQLMKEHLEQVVLQEHQVVLQDHQLVQLQEQLELEVLQEQLTALLVSTHCLPA